MNPALNKRQAGFFAIPLPIRAAFVALQRANEKLMVVAAQVVKVYSVYLSYYVDKLLMLM